MSMTVRELVNRLADDLVDGRLMPDDVVVGELFTWEDMRGEDMNMSDATARFLWREVVDRMDDHTEHNAFDNETMRDVMSDVWNDYVPGDEEVAAADA